MLNYYMPFESKKAKKWVPGVKAHMLTQEAFYNMVKNPQNAKLINDYRSGDATAKTKLPAVCWTGVVEDGAQRKAEGMQPTGLFMVDIDHCEKPLEAWEAIKDAVDYYHLTTALMLAHITPSGKGLRLVFKCTQDFPTLAEHMQWINEKLTLSAYGDFDACVHDISRISFIPQYEDILYIDNRIFQAPFKSPIINNYDEKDHKSGGTAAAKSVACTTETDGYHPLYSTYGDYSYHGTPVRDIIAKYVETYGEPEVGERHTFYNKMVLDFRNICGNSPDVLVDLLPRYDGDDAVAYAGYLSQCRSICRRNNNSTIPRNFFIFLAKNGFYKKNADSASAEEVTTELVEREKPIASMPTPPPVIRELISIAPEDFKVPAINALLPILGTLTSYVRTEDKANAKQLSTSFFSIIYAPPSSGKSFVERYINLLLRDLFLRDEVNDARDAIFARSQQKKSANDRSEAVPQTSVRIMEAKNSEAEFLEKQRNNAGHHMFTYCSEIDQWRKGIRAAGGNKDDMVRIAWDNGKYGQNFKSSNTFKGKVQLFWNVLIAGTSDQLAAYFKNVTNGQVTRCSFAEIENQQYQDKIPVWGRMSAKDAKVVDAFIERCDARTYAEPLNYNP